jgi:DNA-binding beta-propeller fold protein YncE
MTRGMARPPVAVMAVGAVVALLASCAAAPPAAHPPRPSSPPAAPSAAVAPYPAAAPARSLTAPGCSSAVAPARTLAGVRPVMTPVPAAPFGVIASPDGRWVFVSDRSGVTVLRAGSAAAPPAVVRSVPLPRGQQGLGEALTPDGRYLLVAATSETVVLNVARLESGSAPEVTGSLAAPGGAIEVTTSADGRFAFTSLEGTGAVQVSDLARALSAGFGASGVRAGRVPVPLAPVGEAISPDGRWLYVTSEERDPPGGLRGPVTSRRCPGDPDSLPGVVRVIGIAAAERDPATAVRAVAGAGASPVRVVLSPGGQVAWVTARGSNALLGFATSRLTARAPALIADVPVGSAPVGVILVDGGRLAVTADSNRFAGRGAQWLSVVRVPDALRGRPALAGQVRAGAFPRQFAVSPDGRTLYVTNFLSNQLETISVPALVRAARP